MADNFEYMDDKMHTLNRLIDPALIGSVVSTYSAGKSNNITFVIYRQRTLEFATFLKLSCIFRVNNPIDCSVVDGIEDKFRFTVTYTLQCLGQNHLVSITTKTNDLLPLISLQTIYPTFNWGEREAWDLFGIFFIKHPDLRRILTDYGFSGHPLRKDFPLTGFREVHYEDSTKQIEYDSIELSQSYRVSNLLNPWAYEKKV